jgi:ammonia channel protein AmtB
MVVSWIKFGTSPKIIGGQLPGIAACFLWVFPAGCIMSKIIDRTVGLRVSHEEEMELTFRIPESTAARACISSWL